MSQRQLQSSRISGLCVMMVGYGPRVFLHGSLGQLYTTPVSFYLSRSLNEHHGIMGHHEMSRIQWGLSWTWVSAVVPQCWSSGPSAQCFEGRYTWRIRRIDPPSGIHVSPQRASDAAPLLPYAAPMCECRCARTSACRHRQIITP